MPRAALDRIEAASRWQIGKKKLCGFTRFKDCLPNGQRLRGQPFRIPGIDGKMCDKQAQVLDKIEQLDFPIFRPVYLKHR